MSGIRQAVVTCCRGTSVAGALSSSPFLVPTQREHTSSNNVTVSPQVVLVIYPMLPTDLISKFKHSKLGKDI